MKVLSLFSGIGAFEKALKNINQPFELVGFSEIDKYAVKSYCAIHNVSETLNFGDITKIDEKALPKDIDLITYGFPCQDISLAGKQKGLFNDDGTQTRSGLFFEALRIIEETQPKIAIAENVKNLVGKKFNAQFQVVLASLEAAGYNNYWQVLNAKDYGIPQNRERVFIVSIRKDIDTGSFKFPEPFPLELRLKDMLEDEVDEKFYLKNTKDFFIEHSFAMEEKGNGFRFDPHIRKNANIAKTVTTRAGGRMDDNFVIDIESDTDTFKFDSTNEKINMLGLLNIKGNEQVRRVYGTDGISPTLNIMQGGNRQPKVAVEPKIIKVGQIESGYDQSGRVYSPEGLSPTVMSNSHGCTTGGYNPPKVIVEPVALDEQNRYIRKDGCVGTLTTDGSSPKHNNRIIQENLRIRKLTPKECFRLMGFSDEDFAKAEAVNSNTQLYKQAGNSIVVDVIAQIFTSLKSEFKKS